MNRLDPGETIARIDSLAARAAECFHLAAQDAAVRALGSDLPGRLMERVAARADHCRKALAD